MYVLAIIGGGPAGLTAGLYGARANLKTIIIEKGLYGGQMQNTLEIENYPGFKNVGGPELSEHMYNQALAVGCEWKYGDVTQVSLEGQPKVLEVSGEKIEARSVIIASGARPASLESRVRKNSPGGAFPTAQPVTVLSTKTWRLWLWAAATQPWKKGCSSPATPVRSL